MKFIFTNKAKRQWDKLSLSDKEFIQEKLLYMKTSGKYDMKKVHNITPATHRIRAGDFRVIITLGKTEAIVLKVGHRKDIYK